jgi:hypothetical protein
MIGLINRLDTEHQQRGIMVSFFRQSISSMPVKGVKAKFANANAFGSLDSFSLHAHMESWPTAGERPFSASSKGIFMKGENQNHALKINLSGLGKIHLVLSHLWSRQWG